MADDRFRVNEFEWTDAREKRLVELHKEGISASEIGAELGCSRNAVCGKAHRMGLSRPAPVPRPSRVPAAPKVKTLASKKPNTFGTLTKTARVGRSSDAPKLTTSRLSAEPVDTTPRPKANEPLPESRCVKLLGLKSAMCKWPLGDPLTPEFRYCGAGTGDLMVSYCASHRRLAYQPTSKPQKFVHSSVHARTAKVSG